MLLEQHNELEGRLGCLIALMGQGKMWDSLRGDALTQGVGEQ